MAKSDVEQEVEQRLEVIAEDRRRLNFEMTRLRERMDAADAEDYGLRRFLAVLRGEDVSAVPRRSQLVLSRADVMERNRQLAERRAFEERHMAAVQAERAARDEESRRRMMNGRAIIEQATPQRRLNRADAIEEILSNAERPLDRREILSTLIEQGREEESLDAVSATLSHLKRNKRIISIDGGWITPARNAQLREAERAQETAEHATPEASDVGEEATTKADARSGEAGVTAEAPRLHAGYPLSGPSVFTEDPRTGGAAG